MEPILKDLRTQTEENDVVAFLNKASHHFAVADVYPEPDLPDHLKQRYIVLGPNKRTGYYHLPENAEHLQIINLCRLIGREQASNIKDLDLAGFLQGFMGQLKDKVDLNEVARNIIIKVSELFEAEGSAILIVNDDRKSLRFVAVHSSENEIEDKLFQIQVPMGTGVAGWVAANRKPLLVNKAAKDSRFNDQVDKQTEFNTRDLLAAPIILGNRLIGVLEVVNRKRRPFSEWDIPTLCVLASVVAIFLEKAQLVVQQRKYQQVAGKAEIANSVLHNIGNVLNSLTVACTFIDDKLKKSKIRSLLKTNELIEANEDNFGEFINKDPKGKIVPQFLIQVGRQLKIERETLLEEIAKIGDKAHLMKEIIETQQTIARVGRDEVQDVIQIIEEAISVQAETIERLGVEIVRDFHSDRPIRGHKSKLVHILINLIKNGAEAMAHLDEERRILRIETGECERRTVSISVEDQGYGIAADDLHKIFKHGFTTKDDGHGFGLNFCAKAMEEMNGTIQVSSDGPGLGAKFTLTFPHIYESDFLHI
jgi:signal transduction histidine kinase